MHLCLRYMNTCSMVHVCVLSMLLMASVSSHMRIAKSVLPTLVSDRLCRTCRQLCQSSCASVYSAHTISFLGVSSEYSMESSSDCPGNCRVYCTKQQVSCNCVCRKHVHVGRINHEELHQFCAVCGCVGAEAHHMASVHSQSRSMPQVSCGPGRPPHTSSCWRGRCAP